MPRSVTFQLFSGGLAPQEAIEVHVSADLHVLKLVDHFVVVLAFLSNIIEGLLSLHLSWVALKTRNLLIQPHLEFLLLNKPSVEVN